MIEEGTDEEIKENILKHLLWEPSPKEVIAAQRSFTQEADKNTLVVAELVEFEMRAAKRHQPNYPVIKVQFKSHRPRGAVVAKSVRAARRARLALYRLEGKPDESIYTAYLRADA